MHSKPLPFQYNYSSHGRLMETKLPFFLFLSFFLSAPVRELMDLEAITAENLCHLVYVQLQLLIVHDSLRKWGNHLQYLFFNIFHPPSISVHDVEMDRLDRNMVIFSFTAHMLTHCCLFYFINSQQV